MKPLDNTKPLCADVRFDFGANEPLLDLFRERLAGKALDCGCGSGNNAASLRDRGWTVTGITINESERDAASEFCEVVHLADLEHGLPESVESGFDLVLLSHVLEHLLRPEVLLHDIRRVLNPGGFVAVALPNVLRYDLRYKFLLGKFDYVDGTVINRTHLHFYTFDSGANLLQINGYRLLASTVDGNFPLPFLRNVLPRYIGEGIDRIACNWSPGLFGYQLMYVAQPVCPEDGLVNTQEK